MVPEGVEPSTLALLAPHSNQLSYGTIAHEAEIQAYIFQTQFQSHPKPETRGPVANMASEHGLPRFHGVGNAQAVISLPVEFNSNFAGNVS